MSSSTETPKNIPRRKLRLDRNPPHAPEFHIIPPARVTAAPPARLNAIIVRLLRPHRQRLLLVHRRAAIPAPASDQIPEVAEPPFPVTTAAQPGPRRRHGAVVSRVVVAVLVRVGGADGERVLEERAEDWDGGDDDGEGHFEVGEDDCVLAGVGDVCEVDGGEDGGLDDAGYADTVLGQTGLAIGEMGATTASRHHHTTGRRVIRLTGIRGQR